MRRHKNRDREYWLQTAEGLVKWLNRRKRPSGYSRVVNLLNDIREMSRMVYSVGARLSRGYLSWPTKENERRYFDTMARVNSLLEQYRLFPQLEVQADRFWNIRWYSDPHRIGDDFRIIRPKDAVLEIVRLAHSGFADRVRHCQSCGKWFFARFKHQEFCKTKCQQKHYWSSERWRAHRREYMRRYRQLTEAKRFK
jgi:hypothetical protein